MKHTESVETDSYKMEVSQESEDLGKGDGDIFVRVWEKEEGKLEPLILLFNSPDEWNTFRTMISNFFIHSSPQAIQTGETAFSQGSGTGAASKNLVPNSSEERGRARSR